MTAATSKRRTKRSLIWLNAYLSALSEHRQVFLLVHHRAMLRIA
jgi:hypothetical protein